MKESYSYQHQMNNHISSDQNSDGKIMNSQAEVIRSIVVQCNYQSYLELGVYDGSTFQTVSQNLKIAC